MLSSLFEFKKYEKNQPASRAVCYPPAARELTYLQDRASVLFQEGNLSVIDDDEELMRQATGENNCSEVCAGR